MNKVSEMNKVILVWKLLPETTKVHLLTLTDEEFANLKRCHGKLINCINDPDFDDGDQEWLVNFGENLSPDSEIREPSEVEGTLIMTGWIL